MGNMVPSDPELIMPKNREREMLFVALDDCEQATDEDLEVKKNDQLIVMDKSHYEWWLARNLRTGDIGYVHHDLLSRINDIRAKKWYFSNTSRREAERLLEYPDNEPGVFMVRESEHDRQALSLSVLDLDEYQQRITKHFKINTSGVSAAAKRYYISESKLFLSMDDLVQFYSSDARLGVQLTRPCPEKYNNFVFKTFSERRENIELGRQIGDGSFGAVYEGLWRRKHVVAVKTLRLHTHAHTLSARDIELCTREFRAELELMKEFRHEKIVRLWCVCTQGQPELIVTEYMAHGSLLSHLATPAGQRLQLRHVCDMAAQVASGMDYLALRGYVHRDLAARNILVGERNVVKIADFGLARKLPHAAQCLQFGEHESVKFPVKWTAPEMFRYEAHTRLLTYTVKSDVWSYGVLLYELVTLGEPPYRGMSNALVMSKLKYEQYRMAQPPGMCTEPFYAMMLRCWHDEPRERPTFEALYHFFNDFFFVAAQPLYSG